MPTHGRAPAGNGFRCRCGAEGVFRAQPLAHPPADDADEVAAATAINASMEAVIRQCPTQYLWGYFRYKGPRAEILTSATGTEGQS